MSYEINVISRSQTIIVEPTSKSVSIVNEHGPPGPQGETGPSGATGPSGPVGPSGVTQDGGFERHSTAQPQVPLTTGVTISFNILDRQSTPNPFVDYLDAGVAFILGAGNAGVYHITGYVMSQSSPIPSAGSFVAIRVNSLVVARQFIPTQAYGSAEVSTDIWLNDNDVVSLFVSAGATAWNIQAGGPSGLDALSPYLRAWKHVQGPKGDKGDPGGTGVPTSDAWTTPSLLNGWSAYGSPYETPGYYKDPLGIVHLKGLCNQPSSRLQTIFTLPTGYRPLNTALFTVVSQDSFGQVRIGGPVGTGPSDGQVLPTAPIAASAGWISLDGITFRAR